MADTSTTTVKAAAPRLVDKITASYWGAYAGPTIANPSRTSMNFDDATPTDIQSVDSTLTAGYKLSEDVAILGNYRFIYVPAAEIKADGSGGGQDYINKDPWLSLRHSKLIHRGNLNMSADLRMYIPVQNAGKLNTGLRSTQTTTYDIPSTRLTLGTYTFERINSKHAGTSVNDMELYAAVFANYQLTNKLALTGWSDLAQFDIKFDKDLVNKPVDVALGVNWDITPNVSVNPSLTVFPQHVSLQTTMLGAILSAKFL
jgi:hypothetical protein